MEMHVRAFRRSQIAVALAVPLLALVSSCSAWHAEVDGGIWEPPTGWDPLHYTPPMARIYTPDLVSRFEEPDSTIWGGGSVTAFSFTLSHINPPSTDGRSVATFSPERRVLFLEAVQNGMSLVRVSDRAVVAAETRAGLFDTGGAEQPLNRLPGDYLNTIPFSLVPTVPLDEGWYVFRVDLTDAATFLPIAFVDDRTWQREGNVLFARVYHGSRPMWRYSAINCTDTPAPRCAIGVSSTEPVTSRDLGTIRVTYDGAGVTCPASGASSPYGTSVACPPAPPGTLVEIDFESGVIVDPMGRPLVPGDGISSVVEIDARGGAAFPDPTLALDIVRTGS
jgi:hypothetical protein